jgi:hypothetical protein
MSVTDNVYVVVVVGKANGCVILAELNPAEGDQLIYDTFWLYEAFNTPDKTLHPK